MAGGLPIPGPQLVEVRRFLNWEEFAHFCGKTAITSLCYGDIAIVAKM